MKTYEDYLKEHGWRKGLWNDPFSKTYTEDILEDKDKPKKIISVKNVKKSIYKSK